MRRQSTNPRVSGSAQNSSSMLVFDCFTSQFILRNPCHWTSRALKHCMCKSPTYWQSIDTQWLIFSHDGCVCCHPHPLKFVKLKWLLCCSRGPSVAGCPLCKDIVEVKWKCMKHSSAPCNVLPDYNISWIPLEVLFGLSLVVHSNYIPQLTEAPFTCKH